MDQLGTAMAAVAVAAVAPVAEALEAHGSLMDQEMDLAFRERAASG